MLYHRQAKQGRSVDLLLGCEASCWAVAPKADCAQSHNAGMISTAKLTVAMDVANKANQIKCAICGIPKNKNARKLCHSDQINTSSVRTKVPDILNPPVSIF